MTSWHGHRDDADLPETVRAVWKRKFVPRPIGPHGRPHVSNVDLVVLGANGDLVHFFDGFPPRGTTREQLGEYTVRHLQYAISWFDEPLETAQRPLALPDIENGNGIRVIVSLKDDRMQAYQAPVVEAVPLAAADWKPLEYPAEKRTVKAENLDKWLSQVYPPGVMERTSPVTKKVYEVEKVEGTFTLEPAGADDEHRYAILKGGVKFTDEGGDGFTYGGTLEVVLSYPPDGPAAQSLRGVFEGIYPREDRMHRRTRELPLRAVFESRPE